jgi:ABC-2 type transport system ATP-binding protein
MDKEDMNIAVRVANVSKEFVLPHEKVNSLKSLFTGVAKSKSNNQGSSERQQALKDISFEIKKGEFFGIVGRNGSGKSTMLKILAGIYQPTKGSVETKGKLVPFIELGVGFNPELTGRENVYLNGAMLGFSETEVAAMYEGIVEFAELERFMDQKLKNYSSGMQVRLAFSMATRSEADVLLVDEVLAVGDADFQRKCFDYFRKLKKNKKTVIFVSHDMNAIREYCDRAVLIEKSEVVLQGKSSEIASAYTRMFSEEAKSARTDGKLSNDKRWGDRTMTYTDIELSPKTLTDEDETVTLTLTALAHKKIINPVFGFLIKNATGVSIMGTNSQILDQTIDRVDAGKTLKVSWTIPNVFADGRYFIEPAIVHHDGSVVSDWWEEAKTFTTFRDARTAYLVSPRIELELVKPRND